MGLGSHTAWNWENQNSNPIFSDSKPTMRDSLPCQKPVFPSGAFKSLRNTELNDGNPSQGKPKENDISKQLWRILDYRQELNAFCEGIKENAPRPPPCPPPKSQLVSYTSLIMSRQSLITWLQRDPIVKVATQSKDGDWGCQK